MIKKIFLMVLCITPVLLAGPFGDEELQSKGQLTAAEINALNNAINQAQIFNNQEDFFTCCECIIPAAVAFFGVGVAFLYKTTERQKPE